MKILVISLAGIGDTLIASPLIHELRTNFPEARIDALVLYPASRELLLDNPHLNRIHQQNLISSTTPQNLRFLLQLRRQRYDISINTHPQSRLHYRAIARFIGAPTRVSHRYHSPHIIDRLLVNRSIPQDYSVHSVENNLRLLPLINASIKNKSHDFEVWLSTDETNWSARFIESHRLQNRTRLGIHVGSGGTKNLPLKRWPLDHYIALLNKLKDSHPELCILLLGGPGENEDHDKIRHQCTHPGILVPGSKDIRQAAALIRECHAFLSVDTALMHLAAAMKVPNQLVIEAPTLNTTNLPHNTPYTLIPNPAVHGRNLDYYKYDGGPIRGSNEELLHCMQSITVDTVHQAVCNALSRR